MLQRIARKKKFATLPKQVFQREVDGSNGTVKVDRSEKVGSDTHEANQGFDTTVHDGKARRREE